MKRPAPLLTLLFLLLVSVTSAQVVRKAQGTAGQETFSFYYMEPRQEVKGVLLLLPGWGERLTAVFDKTALPRLLAEQGFVTVVPQLRQAMFADPFTLAELHEITAILSGWYKSTNLPLVLGGLSAGGNMAIGFAEHILAGDSLLQLKAVFAIDPPLDLARVYRSAENQAHYQCHNKRIRKQGRVLSRRLRRSLGGSPEERPEQYRHYSAFSAGAADGGNARLLLSLPIRLYSEPDLDYARKTYCSELQYTDINATDLEALSRFLKDSGNQRAEYITTQGKGFHSWNILDAADCANWILGLTALK